LHLDILRPLLLVALLLGGNLRGADLLDAILHVVVAELVTPLGNLALSLDLGLGGGLEGIAGAADGSIWTLGSHSRG